jgi:putative transposase
LGFHIHAQPTRSQELIKKIISFEIYFHILVNIVNSSTEHVILFEDESYIRDYQAIAATWFLKGQQKKIKTYGHHAGVGLFGVLDYSNGRVLCQPSVELNTQAFEHFMETQVIPAYKDKHIFMILDNSKIHHAKALLDFKEKYRDKISFIFLPPYAPNINRIEGLWKWLKQTVIYNKFLKNVTEIDDAVNRFLNHIKYDNEAIKSRLCF